MDEIDEYIRIHAKEKPGWLKGADEDREKERERERERERG
jgi:hypothetical protein